jgi:hypothetical protein
MCANLIFYYFCSVMSSNKERIPKTKMKSFFIFGLRRIKKSTSKAALGIGNRIIRLTSETITTYRLLKQNSFDPSTIFIFRI